MSANRLKVTDLDFDTIKTNLKNFLKNQSEFTDYDFEGSGLNVLLDVLAYNTHYNAYYLNMIANESFLDSSLLRNSVVSHAKKFGYTPRSVSASSAIVNFTVQTSDSTPGTLTLPEGYIFITNLINNTVYNFVTLQDITVSKTGNNFVFENLKIYEGKLRTLSFVHDQSNNPKQIFTIPDENIDTLTMKVSVQESSSNSEVVVHTLATNVVDVTSDSAVYYLQEGKDGYYEIYFGDDVIGKKIPDGGIVNITFLSTNGSLVNKASSFIATTPISGYSNFGVNIVSQSSGGADRETVDQIKYAAPLQYVAQNRAVTKNDYVKLIQQKYPQFDAVNVWGGEENIPPVYGKVFITAKPKEGFEVTETEKDFFITQIVKPISILTVTPEFVDPDYNFIKLISTVYYDPTKTVLNLNTLENKIQSTLINFSNQNLNRFNSIFSSSALKRDIDNSDQSIISNELEIFLSKRFSPDLINPNTYVLDYGVELSRGTTLDNFYSSPNFTMLDEQFNERICFFEEVPSSFTGIEGITILNTGLNYTSTPIIEIVGDGTGAQAVALVVNGQVRSIQVTNPGVGYTSAAVRILGGGGSSAAAEAVLENRYGQIRIAYFKPDEVTSQSTKAILNSEKNNGVMGSIDYFLGKITLNDFNPIDVKNDFKELTINVRPKTTVLQSTKNRMLAFDVEDPTSIVVELRSVI